MTKIIAITNHKGGVGKTTTTVNLAASLVVGKQRVLLVDLDPQGSATVGSGIVKEDIKATIYDVLMDKDKIKVAIQHSPAGFTVLPGNEDLTAAEVELLEYDDRNDRLKQALAQVKKDYDYIVIDCPPSLNILTVNALVAADSVLIPIQCEYYALEGLTSLIDTVKQLQKTLNRDLHIEGLVRTMYDRRNRLARDVSEQLQQHFADKLYHTIIPRNVRLAEAPSHGQPVTTYDMRSKGSLAYLALAYELLHGIGSKNPELTGVSAWLKGMLGLGGPNVTTLVKSETSKQVESEPVAAVETTVAEEKVEAAEKTLVAKEKVEVAGKTLVAKEKAEAAEKTEKIVETNE